MILRSGLASLIGLGSAVRFAIAAILTKALTASESTYAVLLWTNAKQRVAVLVGSGLGFRSKIDGARALPFGDDLHRRPAL